MAKEGWIPWRLPQVVAEKVGVGQLQCWMSPDSPRLIEDRVPRPAAWLKEQGKRKGLYLWLWELKWSPMRHRLLHIGISAKGNSSLETRTDIHCRHQLNGVDPVRKIEAVDGGSGDIGELKLVWERTNKAEMLPEGPYQQALDFMQSVRVIFIDGDKFNEGDRERSLRFLEGVVYGAARNLMGEDELTNTARCTSLAGRDLVLGDPELAESVRESLREAVPSLSW